MQTTTVLKMFLQFAVVQGQGCSVGGGRRRILFRFPLCSLNLGPPSRTCLEPWGGSPAAAALVAGKLLRDSKTWVKREISDAPSSSMRRWLAIFSSSSSSTDCFHKASSMLRTGLTCCSEICEVRARYVGRLPRSSAAETSLRAISAGSCCVLGSS